MDGRGVCYSYPVFGILDTTLLKDTTRVDKRVDTWLNFVGRAPMPFFALGTHWLVPLHEKASQFLLIEFVHFVLQLNKNYI